MTLTERFPFDDAGGSNDHNPRNDFVTAVIPAPHCPKKLEIDSGAHLCGRGLPRGGNCRIVNHCSRGTEHRDWLILRDRSLTLRKINVRRFDFATTRAQAKREA